ncbi:MAG: lipopolysaccharide core heptose(I) kinase RfaP [Victivallaceae bacterium]|nr:lipopolysaccharide core heptose(I) kinase RfaP [Victivallaceae bacterium]
MKLYLDENFTGLWRGHDPFAAVSAIEGEVFRRVKSRRTLRFELGGKIWFLKHHLGVGWGEIVKNLLVFKLPVIGAGNEYRAIRKLEAIGVKTMHCAAYGERNLNPAARESFIVTAEIPEAESLEDTAKRAIPAALKRRLIREVAAVSRRLHDNGVNHRDYYLCHFLLSSGELHLIDLHRMQIRRRIPAHYLFKDMGGLWFSAMDAKLSRTDCFRFIAAYSGRPPAVELRENRRFWQKINRVGEKLYRREFGRDPQHAFSENGKTTHA